jgi:excinuclease UvrABC nuclease subunit
LKKDLYSFLKDFREPDGHIINFNTNHFEELPAKSGAYIFLSDNELFTYPTGKSRVIYIGMSQMLNMRLRQHVTHISNLKSVPKGDLSYYWYYPRYQYINQFGCNLFWYTTRGTQNAKTLECKLLEYFYNKYLALPIGNGAFSFS